MFIEQALTSYLLSHTGLKALIGTKLYPEEIPQNTKLPAVYYLTISDTKDHILDGQCNVESPYIQWTVCAASKSSAKAVAEQIKSALCDYRGTLSGIKIQKIELQNELPSFEKSADGTIKIYTHDLEFQIDFVKE